MGRRLRRKRCDVMPCRPGPFFGPAVQRQAGDDAFFQKKALQRQEKAEEEKKDPLVEGLKTTGEKLVEHEPLKKWFEPKLELLKHDLWEKASAEDKAALITFLAMQLGVAGAAFATNPELRKALSDVNIGKPLGWIPYSPVEGFKYRLPEAGKSAYGFSGDFTFNPYLDALHKKYPGIPLTGATFGLDTEYDPARGNFGVTGGKFGLDFFGGGLKAEGKTFKDLSPYPQLIPGRFGEPGSWLMQEVPGLPQIGGPGYQFTIHADVLKMFPQLGKWF